MTPYQEAVESTGIQIGSWAELCVRRVLAALSDDGPVIVVDGKVAALTDAVGRLLASNPHNGVVEAMAEGLANAAQEVAE